MSGFVLGNAGIDDAADIVFLVFDFAQKIILFFVFVVLDFDVLDGDFLVGIDNGHARFRFGFFFLGVLVLVLAGRRDLQRRLDHGLGFFFLFVGLGGFVFVLIFFIVV